MTAQQVCKHASFHCVHLRANGLIFGRNGRRWFEALEQRDTYSATQSDFYTHCWDIPPQYGPPHAAPSTQAYANAIDGQDGKSWHLPLPPLNSQSFEPRSNVKDDGNVRSYNMPVPL